jgi:hypothetical protein
MSIRLKIILIALNLISLLLFVQPQNSMAGVSDKQWKVYEQFIDKYYVKTGEMMGNPTARLQALNNLAYADDPKLVLLLVNKIIPYELEQNALLVIDEIIKIIAGLKDEQTIAQLIQSLQDTSLEIKMILMTGMVQINNPVVTDRLIKMISDKEKIIQIAAINALSFSCPKEATPSIIKALDSNIWEVRACAINYLAKLKDEESKKSVIEAFKSRLDKERVNRLRADLSRGISMLAGEAIPPSGNPGETLVDAGRFFGLPLNSNNVVFVIDVSSSMLADAKEGGCKIELVRKELINTIKNLSPRVRFNIITFQDNVVAWQNQLLSSQKNREQALNWINANVQTIDPKESTGGVNLYDAIESAFGYTAAEKNFLDSKNIAYKADTIFLVTDGLPNQGKYVMPDEIFNAVLRLNQSRQIKINTIAFGVKNKEEEEYDGRIAINRSFMKQLAEENQGVFIEK